MIGYRWLRAAARWAVGLLTALPAVALVLAVLVDRGPDGELRDPWFPLALFASDPFAWTCARNSLIFAAAVTIFSLIGGVGLGGILARRTFWSRGAGRAAVASLLAAPPAGLAIGFLGIGGTPQSWPWLHSLRDATTGGLSLESWSGLPLWGLWIWASLPCAPRPGDARDGRGAGTRRTGLAGRRPARGAGRLRTWHGLTWPLVRPAAARAAAIVFPLALFEPGVPLVLGLRRTLSFQIVEAAARPEPFPRIAVWTMMAAVFSIAGRWLLRRWGGPALLDMADRVRNGVHSRSPARRAGVALAMAGVAILAGAVSLGWLPVLGLVRLLGRAGSTSWPLAEFFRQALSPPVPQLLINSLVLGFEVGLVVLVLAWLLRPDPGARHASTFRSRLVGRVALMPPLAQGVGILALPGLVDITALLLTRIPGLEGSAARMAHLSRELDFGRNPWPLLTAAVGLSVGSRLLQSWRRAAERRPDETRAGLDAALLAGCSQTRARFVAALGRGRWVGGSLLAALLAAVNLAPALLFSPWMDGRTIASGDAGPRRRPG